MKRRMKWRTKNKKKSILKMKNQLIIRESEVYLIDMIIRAKRIIDPSKTVVSA